MNALEAINLQCPCCGEAIELVVDCSLAEQQYSEDCPVCCRPLQLQVWIDEAEGPRLEVSPENY